MSSTMNNTYSSRKLYGNRKAVLQQEKKWIENLCFYDDQSTTMTLKERMKNWYVTGWKDKYGEWQIDQCDTCKKPIYLGETVNEIRTIRKGNMVFVDDQCVESMIKSGMKRIKKGERIEEINNKGL